MKTRLAHPCDTIQSSKTSKWSMRKKVETAYTKMRPKLMVTSRSATQY